MDSNYSLIKSYLGSMEHMIGSLDEQNFNNLREDLGRIRRAIKRRSMSMSLPISKPTLAAAHRHCAHLGLDLTKWVDQAVAAALERERAHTVGTKDPEKESRRLAKKWAKTEKKLRRHLVKSDTYLAVKGLDFVGHSAVDGLPVYSAHSKKRKKSLVDAGASTASPEEVSTQISPDESRPIKTEQGGVL
jgi:hypothetical protein